MKKDILLDISNVTVSFEGFLALKQLNLSLKQGELRAVIGPNGAGKTTFLDVITGKVKPTSGDVFFKGKSLIGKKEHKIARIGVGRKFQSPRIFENLTVEKNLEIAVSQYSSPIKIIASKPSIEKTEEVTETDAFASIISECMTENIEVNLDLPNGERLHVTPDVASVLSETHDNLPKEMQQSFREMVFESKDKYTKILETIVTGEEQ